MQCESVVIKSDALLLVSWPNQRPSVQLQKLLTYSVKVDLCYIIVSNSSELISAAVMYSTVEFGRSLWGLLPESHPAGC